MKFNKNFSKVYCKLGCNSVYNQTVVLCIFSFLCSSVFRPYLKQYNPQTAKLSKGHRFSKIHTRELNKNYFTYFSLTQEGKSSLAESLGIPLISLSKWMLRKRQEERELEEAKNQLQTHYKQEHGLNVSGNQ